MKNILPYILVFFTKVPRYKPKIEWSNKSWVHNIFRAYEYIFWRRYGIRCESKIYVDNNTHVYEFYTWEAMFSHIESYIRGLIPKLSLKYIYIPALQTNISPQFNIFNHGYLFAVGYDNSIKDDSSGSSTKSVSYTTSGSDRFLVINASCSNDIVINTASYNSVSATFIVKSVASGASVQQANLYGLVAPATGSNTLTVTSASSDCRLFASSYTGVDQTTPTTNATTNNTDGTTSSSLTITPTNSGSWLFGAFQNNNGNDNTAGANTTLRQNSGAGVSIGDTNAGVSSSTTISSSGAGTASLRRSAGFAIKTSSVSYMLTADYGSFILTGQSALLKRGLRMIADYGSFILTGFSVGLNKGYGIVASMGSFILTGYNAVLRYSGWASQKKNTTTWSSSNKNNTTWNSEIK